MSETPCETCHGLGFVSYDEEQITNPFFNVANLFRRKHPNGKVTLEGECRVCHGTGMNNQRTSAIR